MRLIDADAFDERVRVAVGMSENDLPYAFKDGVKATLYMLSKQPTIEERKRGKWIFVRGEEAGNALYECSACGKGDIHAPEVRVPYCWHCGAAMKGEQDERPD